MSDQARHIDWQFLGREHVGTVAAGDLVSADAGGLPIYRVLTLDQGRAWLRDIDTGADQVSGLAGFHWRAQG